MYDRIYINPEMAKTVVRTMAREQGEAFEIANSIGRDLADAGLVLTTQEGGETRHTIHKRIRNVGNQRY